MMYLECRCDGRSDVPDSECWSDTGGDSWITASNDEKSLLKSYERLKDVLNDWTMIDGNIYCPVCTQRLKKPAEVAA